TQAFTSGKVTDAKVILQGQLADFPYDHGKGIFLIEGPVKEVGLHLAKGWPDIQHAEGQLTFAGRKMIASLHSANWMDVRLMSVQGEIPNMGIGNPVLNLTGKASLALPEGKLDLQSGRGSLVISDQGVDSGNFSGQLTANAPWYQTLSGKPLPLSLKMGRTVP